MQVTLLIIEALLAVVLTLLLASSIGLLWLAWRAGKFLLLIPDVATAYQALAKGVADQTAIMEALASGLNHLTEQVEAFRGLLVVDPDQANGNAWIDRDSPQMKRQERIASLVEKGIHPREAEQRADYEADRSFADLGKNW